MSKRAIAMLASVVALAMLLAACGGGSDEETLTKAEFIKQADKICKEVTDDLAAEYKVFMKEAGIKEGEFPDKKQGVEIAEDIYIPSYEKRTELLRELGTPEEGEEAVEAWIKATEDGVDEAEANVQLLFQPGRGPFDDLGKMARSYGFKVCA